MRVLVVDDDEDIQAALSEALLERGYEVETAANGLEALNKIRSGARPSVVILDLMMPVMDGWAFSAKLVEDPELAEIPIIVLSAAASYWGIPERTFAHFSKPFDLSAVIRAIEEGAL